MDDKVMIHGYVFALNLAPHHERHHIALDAKTALSWAYQQSLAFHGALGKREEVYIRLYLIKISGGKVTSNSIWRYDKKHDVYGPFIHNTLRSTYSDEALELLRRENL